MQKKAGRDQRLTNSERAGSVGKAYTSLLEDYVAERWDSARAARRAESLRRALRDIRRLLREAQGRGSAGG